MCAHLTDAHQDVCTTDMPDTHQGPSNPTLTVAAYLTWLSPYKAVMCDLLCGLTAAHPLTSTLPPRTLKSPQLFLLQQFSESEESLACFLSVKIPWFYEICVFCSRELKTLHLSHRLSVNTPHKPGSRWAVYVGGGGTGRAVPRCYLIFNITGKTQVHS